MSKKEINAIVVHTENPERAEILEHLLPIVQIDKSGHNISVGESGEVVLSELMWMHI